jgi:hypothetical protein
MAGTPYPAAPAGWIPPPAARAESIRGAWRTELELADPSRVAIIQLTEVPELSDLGPVAACRSLVTLELDGTGVRDLGPLQGAWFLNALVIRRSPVEDLWPLARCTFLDEIELVECPAIVDLSPLIRVPALRRLRLERCPNLSPQAIESFRRARPRCRTRVISD